MSAPYRESRSRIPLIAGAVAFLVHLVANPHYGYFRDELYFIICGRHPALGYVDQPPLIPLLAAGTQLFGHSLLLLRGVAALFAGASVFVTSALAAELDGGVFAQETHLFRSAERAALLTSPLVMPWENPLPIMVCRGITRPLAEVWPAKKHYY